MTAAFSSMIALFGGSVATATSAFASGASYYYVDNTIAACTDSGSGMAAAPFCTIQAAVDKAVAGDTVDVLEGTFTSPVTMSTSGTATAPITLMFSNSRSECGEASGPNILLPLASTRSALTVSNASYIDIENPCVYGGNTGAGIVVQNSSQVLVEGGYVSTKGDGIDLTGNSVGDTVERTEALSASTGVAVSSVSDATISTSDIIANGTSADGVTVSGASDTDIVSSTIVPECITGVSVSGGSSATAMENNVIGTNANSSLNCDSATPIGLSVTADSASEFSENYDSIGMPNGVPADWAGTVYKSVSTYKAATGQGANDLFGINDLTNGSSPQYYVDNADASAGGEQSTDIDGFPRVDDPNIPNTGTGVGYYDRGAFELQSPIVARFTTETQVGGRGITVGTAQVAPCGTWGSTYIATLQWGDGQSTTQSGKPCDGETFTASHEYASAGIYTMTLTVTDGYSTVTTTEFAKPAGLEYSSYGPTRILDTRKGIGAAQAKVGAGGFVKVKVAGNGSIPADAEAVALNLTATDTSAGGYAAVEADGAGKPTTSNVNFSPGQTVANSTIVQVSADGYIDIYNGATGPIDLIADVTGYFTPSGAAGYNTVAPDRILDTRIGTGAPKAQVGSLSGLPVGIVGVDGIPASATAVAVHVTVTNTRGGGYVAAVPDGSGTPTTSSVNFSAGQTASNTVIAPIAADGKIKLFNGATGPVDLIADVAGYFTRSSANVLVPVAPTRVLDTRQGSGPLKSDSTNYYAISPSSHTGVISVVANLTATQPTAGGNLQAYPVGTTRPGVSNVNFSPGQTVANLALLTNSASTGADTYIYNDAGGTTQLIIDVFGYFESV